MAFRIYHHYLQLGRRATKPQTAQKAKLSLLHIVLELRQRIAVI